MYSVTWDWFKVRVAALLTATPVIAPNGQAVPATRLGWHFNPPKPTTNQ